MHPDVALGLETIQGEKGWEVGTLKLLDNGGFSVHIRSKANPTVFTNVTISMRKGLKTPPGSEKVTVTMERFNVLCGCDDDMIADLYRRDFYNDVESKLTSLYTENDKP